MMRCQLQNTYGDLATISKQIATLPLAIFMGLFIESRAVAISNNLYTYQFSAGKNHFVFLQEIEKNRRIVVDYDVSRKKFRVFGSRSALISGPRVNSADTAFYVAAMAPLEPRQLQAGQKGNTDLYRCGFGTDHCAPVFQFHGAIGSPVDLDDGAMLFIGAMPRVVVRALASDAPRVVYAGFEFYRRDNSGAIRRLTEWQGGQLASASLAGNRLVFQFVAVPSNVPLYASFPWRTSEIYEATIDHSSKISGFDQKTTQPFLVHGKRIDTRPSLSPNGDKTAFLSASDAANGQWKYDIVVFDNQTKKELHTVQSDIGTNLTSPIFVDQDTIAFVSFNGSDFTFRHLDVSNKHEKVLGQLSLIEIRKANVIEIE